MSLCRFQRQRQLSTSFATVLLLCCASHSSFSGASFSSLEAPASQHIRRLNDQRIDCPVGVAFCDNPFDILVDPTVACDEETCAWLVTLLDPDSKPVICRSIQLVGDDIPDFLEPCLWWELLYGDLRPTPAPSSSLELTPGPSSGTYGALLYPPPPLILSLLSLFALLPILITHTFQSPLYTILNSSSIYRSFLESIQFLGANLDAQ
jgi:hypothetical protein